MEVFYIFLNAIRFVFLVMNLTGNSLVLLTISKVKSLQGPTTYLINNLAYSDLAFGFVLALGYGFSNLYGESESNVKSESSSSGKRTYGLEFYYHALLSSWTLVAIATERYLAIVKPFYHRAHVTKKKLRNVLIIMWILDALFGIAGYVMLLFFPGPKQLFHQGYQFQGNTTSNFTVLLNSSVAWFNSSDSLQESIETMIQFGYELFLVISCTAVPASFMGYFYGRIIYSVWFKPVSQQGTNTGILKTRRKLTKLLLTVTVIFYLCWLPLFVILSDQVTEGVKKVCILFPLFSTTINPIIYSLHSKPFRQGIKSLFACCCRKRRVCVEKSTRNEVRSNGCCCYRSWTVFRGNGNGLENTDKTNETMNA